MLEITPGRPPHFDHVVAHVVLFTDDSCETSVIAEGTREACEDFAERHGPIDRSYIKPVKASHFVVRERGEWDRIITECELAEHLEHGGMLS